MTLPLYSLKREATLPDQQAWHTGQLTSDPSFHLSHRATPEPILQLLQGRSGHSWHSSTVLCWAWRASSHQQHAFTQEISVRPNGCSVCTQECVCVHLLCEYCHFFCSFTHCSGHIVSLFTSSTAFPFSHLKIHVLNYRSVSVIINWWLNINKC